MDYYAGIDVSLEASSVCVMDVAGKIAREAKIASEPDALIGWLASLGLDLARIGLEAGPLSQWFYAALKQAGLAVELLETRALLTARKLVRSKLYDIEMSLREFDMFEKRVRAIAGQDRRVRLMMSALGVGPIVALTYVSAIDDPSRFSSSKRVGPHFGLTPRKYQSGETDVTGRITKIGDAGVRMALYEAANVILTRRVRAPVSRAGQ